MVRRCKNGTRDHRAHPRFKPVPDDEQRYVINRITPNGQRCAGNSNGIFPTPQMIYEFFRDNNLRGTFVLMSTRPRFGHIATIRTLGKGDRIILKVLKSSHELYDVGWISARTLRNGRSK